VQRQGRRTADAAAGARHQRSLTGYHVQIVL
jgi:hypothetical protein